MSLTLYQNGNNLNGILIYPNSVNFPAFFTATSSLSDVYVDFKYSFKIYDSSGEVFQQYKSPGVDGIGIFNPNKIIKSFLKSDIKPNSEIEYIDYLKEYRITIQEYYNGQLNGSEISYEKSLGGDLSYNQTDSKLPYSIINDKVGDFLTHQTTNYTYSQSENTESNWMLTLNNDIEDIKYIKYFVTYLYSDNSIRRYLYNLEIDSIYEFINTDATINSAETGALKFPIGFGTLKNTTIRREGYYDESNTWHAHAGTQSGIVDVNITFDATPIKLEVQLFDSLNVSISELYSWNLVCDNKDITISWENIYGGIDFHNFNKIRNDVASNNRKMYIHNSFTNSSNNIYNNLDETNYTTYNSDKAYSLVVRTDILSISEIDLLKGLWFSDLIYMNIDGINYPIVSITKTKEIPHPEKADLFAYELNIQYSKIIR